MTDLEILKKLLFLEEKASEKYLAKTSITSIMECLTVEEKQEWNDLLDKLCKYNI